MKRELRIDWQFTLIDSSFGLTDCSGSRSRRNLEDWLTVHTHWFFDSLSWQWTMTNKSCLQSSKRVKEVIVLFSLMNKECLQDHESKDQEWIRIGWLSRMNKECLLLNESRVEEKRKRKKEEWGLTDSSLSLILRECLQENESRVSEKRKRKKESWGEDQEGIERRRSRRNLEDWLRVNDHWFFFRLSFYLWITSAHLTGILSRKIGSRYTFIPQNTGKIDWFLVFWVFTVELPREIGENGRFYTQKYGKDRKEFLSAPAIKGKRAIPQKYGKDRIIFLSVAFVSEKALTNFDPYGGYKIFDFLCCY